MKTLNKTILVLMAVIAVSLTSCKKDDDGGGDGGGGQAGSGQIIAKVNGNNFTSMEIASKATLASGTLILQGSDASGKGIFITMNNYDGVGTYEFSDSNVFTVGTYIETDINNPQNSKTWTAPYEGSGVVGEIRISEKTDTNIKGTFNFTGKNVNGDNSLKNITDGSFNLNF